VVNFIWRASTLVGQRISIPSLNMHAYSDQQEKMQAGASIAPKQELCADLAVTKT
jgi:hypothetical protein